MKVIVLGGSSGIGAELVRQLAAREDQVAAVARRFGESGGTPESRVADGTSALPVRTYAHDVTHFDEVPALFQQITQDLGGLDAIIYAAGVMPEVGANEFDFEKDRAIIDVNLTGAVAWLNQAAIRFQKVGAGTIVGIGSVAGERGRQGQPVYNTTKAALKTYLEALRNRLSRYGVNVVTIKPGPTATPMTAHLDQTKMMPVEKAAELILSKMGRSGEYYLNPAHGMIFAVIRNVPSVIFRRLKL